MGVEFETTVTIKAPVERVWDLLADLERWPGWTASMKSVKPIGDGPLGVGTRAKVRQPGLPPATWTVTSFEPRHAFTWMTKSPGVATAGIHRLDATVGRATTTVTLEVRQTGWAAGLAKALYGKRTRQYVQMEADGLKAAAERDPASP